MKKIIIIDDDPIVVQSLKMIIENGGYNIVMTGFNSKQAIEGCRKYQPDILLLDIRLKEETGIDIARELIAENPILRILLVTTFQDDQYIHEALQIGCKGYILKQNIQSLLPAIEAVLSDQFVLDNQIMKTITQSVNTSHHQSISAKLSIREWDVFECVAKGMNNREIAQALFLSEGTIRNYISSLLEKLNLRDRTQLAIYYYREKANFTSDKLDI